MDTVLAYLRGVLEDVTSFEDACKAAVTVLHRLVPHFHWVGIYLKSGDELVLAAWVGPGATEHTRIPIGKGICGLAARVEETVIVDDVTDDPRYLACFPQTRSEIVVPLLKEGEVIGEIDIDSDKRAAFSSTDRTLLEEIAVLIAERWDET